MTDSSTAFRGQHGSIAVPFVLQVSVFATAAAIDKATQRTRLLCCAHQVRVIDRTRLGPALDLKLALSRNPSDSEVRALAAHVVEQLGLSAYSEAIIVQGGVPHRLTVSTSAELLDVDHVLQLRATGSYLVGSSEVS